VLSTTLIGSGMGWGPTWSRSTAYLNDSEKRRDDALDRARATLRTRLSLPRRGGELSATMTVRRKSYIDRGDGRKQADDREDQVCVTGLPGRGRVLDPLSGGIRAAPTCSGRSTAPRAICNSRRRRPRADLRDGRARGKGAQSALRDPAVPKQYRWSPPQDPGPSTNVAQAYARFARDYREGTHSAPRSTTPSHASHAGRDRDRRGNRRVKRPLGEIEHDFRLLLNNYFSGDQR